MTLKEKLEEHMQMLSDAGNNMSIKSNSQILLSYYSMIGLTPDVTVTEWLYRIAIKEYPAYGSVTRAIRAAREANPEWRKRNVHKSIEETRKEIGY